jgi:hypothetical protein
MKSLRITKMNANYRVFQNLGVNRNVSPFLPIQGEWKTLINADIDKVGVISKRDGYVKVLNAPDASEVLSLIPINVGAVNKMIMINAAGKLYCADMNGANWGSALVTGLNTSARWRGAIFHDDEGTAVILLGNGKQILKSSDLATYGSELLSAANWTSTGWTGGWAAGWAHTVGNTTILSNTLAATIGTKYRISFTVTGRTAGTFTVSFGGRMQSGNSKTGKFVFEATDTDNFEVLPSSTFNGTIVFSIKAITGVSADLGVAFSDATADGVPLGKYFDVFQERIYTSGVEADEGMIHWCSVGNALDWSMVAPSDSNSLNVDKYSGGIIKNIKMINDRLVIWKDKKVKQWDEEYLKTVMASAGIDAPYSLAEIDGMAFTYDREAIRMFDGNYPQNISEKIKDWIYGVSKTAANLQKVCGEIIKNRYYLSVGDITDEDSNVITNAWIVYDYMKNMFWAYSLADRATAMSKFVNGTTGEENLYFGDSNGQVYKMFSGDLDDTHNIEMIAKSHVTYPVGAEAIITPKKMTVAGKFLDEAKIMMSCDFGAFEPVGDLPDPVSVNLIPEEKFGNGVRGFELLITHATKGKPYIYGYTLNYDIGEERV